MILVWFFVGLFLCVCVSGGADFVFGFTKGSFANSWLWFCWFMSLYKKVTSATGDLLTLPTMSKVIGARIKKIFKSSRIHMLHISLPTPASGSECIKFFPWKIYRVVVWQRYRKLFPCSGSEIYFFVICMQWNKEHSVRLIGTWSKKHQKETILSWIVLFWIWSFSIDAYITWWKSFSSLNQIGFSMFSFWR